MKRIYIIIELNASSSFDVDSDEDLDALGDDLLYVTHGVDGVTVYPSLEALQTDVKQG